MHSLPRKSVYFYRLRLWWFPNLKTYDRIHERRKSSLSRGCIIFHEPLNNRRFKLGAERKK